MQSKTLFLATALAMLPAGAAIAQPANAPATAPAQDAATATAQPNAAAPAGEQATNAPAVATSLATPADLKPGVPVFDSTGATLGTIDSVTPAGAVIAVGDVRAEVPAASFAKNDQGLVLGITKAEFEAAVNRAQS